MKNIVKILLGVLLVTLFTTHVQASELPKAIADKLKEAFPKMAIRFDSLIELQDGTQYLPVYPPVYKDTETPANIVYTLPKSSKLEDKPDIIQFENELSLFKIIRKPGRRPTIKNNPNIPITVKLGLLPQDLLVPEHMVIPTELRILLGDLIIPVVEEIDEFKYLANLHGQNDYIKPAVNMKSVLISDKSVKYKDLYEKSFYVVNYKTSALLNIDPEVGRPRGEIKLSSLPFDIKTTWDNRYILAPSISEEKVFVIDTIDKKIIKELKTGVRPNSLVIIPTMYKAFVANAGSSTISVINLKKMEVVQEIPVAGSPTKLVASNTLKALVYVDSITNSVYSINLETEEELYAANYVCKTDNISKVILHDGLYYVLSRTNNNFKVFDPAIKQPKSWVDENEIVRHPKSIFKSTVVVGKKSVDIKIVKDKLYVLSAGADELLVFNKDDYDLEKVVKLESGGFPKEINLISYGRKALISCPDTYELLLFDFATNEIEQRIPVSIPVNAMVVTRNLQ